MGEAAERLTGDEVGATNGRLALLIALAATLLLPAMRLFGSDMGAALGSRAVQAPAHVMDAGRH
jgi:hypothetical protein